RTATAPPASSMRFSRVTRTATPGRMCNDRRPKDQSPKPNRLQGARTMDSSEQNGYSRRDFGKIVLAGLPLSMLLQKPDSKIDGVQIGSITYSFRTIPNAEDIIKAY